MFAKISKIQLFSTSNENLNQSDLTKSTIVNYQPAIFNKMHSFSRLLWPCLYVHSTSFLLMFCISTSERTRIKINLELKKKTRLPVFLKVTSPKYFIVTNDLINTKFHDLLVSIRWQSTMAAVINSVTVNKFWKDQEITEDHK